MSLQSLLAEHGAEWLEECLYLDPAHARAYAADAYAFDSQPPPAVFLPRTQTELQRVVKACVEHDLPMAPRGAGTGLSGGCVSREGAVQIGCSRLRRIVEIDPLDRIAVVEAGVVNLELSQEARRWGLYFAPDPSSQIASTVGGNFAENAGGPHTLKYAVTRAHVLGIRMIDAEGEWVELGGPHAPMPGGDLLGLHCGAEGTLGIVAELILRLSPRARAVYTVLAAFDEAEDAADTVAAIVAAGVVPAAMEFIDRVVLRAVEEAFELGLPVEAGAVLLVEVEGSAAAVAAEKERVLHECRSHGVRQLREAGEERERARLWKARKHAFGALGRLAPRYATQDGVVPRAEVPAIVRRVGEVARAHDLTIGIVLHAGDGNLHPAILYDDRDPRSVRAALDAGHEILEACISLGGSPTGEHGVGLEKRDFLDRLWSGYELEQMAQLRQVFDPQERCNPAKLLPSGAGCGEGRPRHRRGILP